MRIPRLEIVRLQIRQYRCEPIKSQADNFSTNLASITFYLANLPESMFVLKAQEQSNTNRADESVSINRGVW
ncbi:hypothetical protein K0M31_017197 [Melipona bicolor]|uniref:Uncharacterized protein n=1 Tax=Melipona bicolor TaxID=60889 RepID=A0AA40G546_9HYME|nr:hypothetical protein K0M31_017197 [Melipona bicolor]